jgi:hypothetical protein
MAGHRRRTSERRVHVDPLTAFLMGVLFGMMVMATRWPRGGQPPLLPA